LEINAAKVMLKIFMGKKGAHLKPRTYCIYIQYLNNLMVIRQDRLLQKKK